MSPRVIWFHTMRFSDLSYLFNKTSLLELPASCAPSAPDDLSLFDLSPIATYNLVLNLPFDM